MSSKNPQSKSSSGGGDEGTPSQEKITVPPPVLKRLPPGTTIAPDNLDPLAPVPSVAASAVVGGCGGTPGVSVTG